MTSVALILLLTGLTTRSLLVAHGLDETAKIAEADNALKQTFGAVLAAEKEGANVSALMVKMNQAGMLLAQAAVDYRSGNSGEAVNKAAQCLEALQSVSEEALALKDKALKDAQQAFWNTITVSIVSAILSVVVLVLVWHWFRNHYLDGLLKMKPEAIVNAES
jgi:CHASE3 domain sensor protein